MSEAKKKTGKKPLFRATGEVRVVGTASVMSRAELELGAARLLDAGLNLKIDPVCFKRHQLYAGRDEERALSLFRAGQDAEVETIWCARGGYGGVRLIPHLERLEREHGKPRPMKRLVGYSDSTALTEFVHSRWGWSVLHSSMPGLKSFLKIPEASFQATLDFALGERGKARWDGKGLKRMLQTPVVRSDIEAELVGGNLTVLASLAGTRYAPLGRDRFVFLEDVDERPFRMDRCLQQLVLSGMLDGAKALFLGTFTDCDDRVGTGLVRLPKTPSERKRMIEAPKPKDLAPLRPALSDRKVLEALFGEVGARLGIPVFSGLPCGHGALGQNPLPLYGRYSLSVDGKLSLLDWDGFARPSGMR